MTDIRQARLNVLLEDYRSLKQEMVTRIQIYNQQAQFVQFYGALIAGIAAIASVMEPSQVVDLLDAKRPLWQTLVLLFLLVVGGSIPLFLGASAMTSSYSFMFVRRRLGEVEKAINELVATYDEAPALIYESRIAPRFLESTFYGNYSVTPHVISGVFRVAGLTCVEAILAVVGVIALPGWLGVAYALLIASATLAFIVQYWRLATPSGRRQIADTYDAAAHITYGPDQVPPKLRTAVMGFGLSYAALLVSMLLFTPPAILRGYLQAISTASIYELVLGLTTWGFLTGTVVPLPSEAPIGLVGTLSLPVILVATAIGRGIGTSFTVWLVAVNKAGVYAQYPWIGRLAERASLRFPKFELTTSGWVAFFICQAIPFAPLRASAIVLGTKTTNEWGVVVFAGMIASFAATIRMLLMLVLISTGQVAIDTIRP